MRYSVLLLVLFCSAALARELPDTDPASGLYKDTGWELVAAHCGGCHSTRLVSQNRMSRANWLNTIRWMQTKQGLWDLGENEQLIVAYLARNYGIPDLPLRRKPLELSEEQDS
jgi:mono/diheme cytochrome c family protein